MSSTSRGPVSINGMRFTEICATTDGTWQRLRIQSAGFVLASAASSNPPLTTSALLSGRSARIFPARSSAFLASSYAAAGNIASPAKCIAT